MLTILTGLCSLGLLRRQRHARPGRVAQACGIVPVLLWIIGIGVVAACCRSALIVDGLPHGAAEW